MYVWTNRTSLGDHRNPINNHLNLHPHKDHSSLFSDSIKAKS